MSEEKKTDLLALLLRPEAPDVTHQLPTARCSGSGKAAEMT